MGGSVEDPLRAAAAAGPAGPADGARARYVRDYEHARAGGDLEAMVAAALGLAATQRFGAFPGRVPAFLHEAYTLAQGVERARLAVAVARAWAYGADPARAEAFAAEALGLAETVHDPVLLAQALDAQLLVHWGPDDLGERLRIAARLEDTVAHVTDVELRMSAHLWRLTTALERLDAPTVRRQLRALDLLAEESGSPRVRFFAASRRGMEALLTGDLDGARAALGEAVAAGSAAGEADTYAIERTLTAGIARQSADTSTLGREAAVFEEFGVRESVTSIAAEAAKLWVAAGEPARARALLHQLAGVDFSGVARDVDWLLTMTSLTEVAVATGAEPLAARAADMLAPYAGRGVVNAGGVAFVGVVDDYLAQAARLTGRDTDAREWTARAAAAYQRMGATWWLHRLPEDTAEPGRPGLAHLRPGDGIWWVGRDGAPSAVRDLKGLHYLRHLLLRPGVDVSALDLSAAVAGHPGVGVVEPGTGELLDRQALASYRRRLGEIDEDLEQARSWSDAGQAERLGRERDALLAELRAATGLSGRRRASGGSSERARVAVRKAIAAAIDRVAAVDPWLGRLLVDTVSTGTSCRYDPDPDRPVRWVLTGWGRPAG